jgi:hypothetical protein
MQILPSEFNLNIFRHDYRGIYHYDKNNLRRMPFPSSIQPKGRDLQYCKRRVEP